MNLPSTYSSWSSDQKEAITFIQKQFHISTDRAKIILHQFENDFNQGLADYDKDLAMIPTYVTGVPNGFETGTFLALDLGGTNLRVCQVHLLGNGKFSMEQTKYTVSEELKTGDSKHLFDYIAECVDSFISQHNTSQDDCEPPPGCEMHLGFTFSFPVQQTAIDSGKLLTWTKGFKCSNAIGKDVVQLLQDAFSRRHIKVRCTALVNDTVGTLMTRAYSSGNALLGCIFGTGTNAAYIEEMKKITKLSRENLQTKSKYMVINTEWGAFDNKRRVLPITMFDNKVDRESINPRKQAFEKMVSGMYLGEITRNVLLHLIDIGILFNGYSSTDLNTHYGFDTSYMSTIEADMNPGEINSTTAKLLESLDIKKEWMNSSDREMVQMICRIVGTRAAKLAACAMGAIMTHTGYADKLLTSNTSSEKIIAGVDGTVFEHYPNFENRMVDTLGELLGKNIIGNIDIGIAKDGSGVGAALCALQAKKQSEEKN